MEALRLTSADRRQYVTVTVLPGAGEPIMLATRHPAGVLTREPQIPRQRLAVIKQASHPAG